MRKLALLVLLVAIAVTALSVYRLQDKNGLFSAPWEETSPLLNLSRVAEAADGTIVAIGESKQRLLRFSTDGQLIAEIGHTGLAGSDRRDFTEAVVDNANRIVALDTLLDSFGLYVASEEIVIFDEKGKSPKVLYELPGDGQSKRVGQIKGLQIVDGMLYFHIARPERVSLMKVSLDGGNATEVYVFPLPKDRYLSEVIGTLAGQIYYSTKRGGIFHVLEDGTSKLLYPLETMDRTRKNFPERLSFVGDGNLEFVDRLLNAVTVMTPGEANGLRIAIDGAALEQAAPDADGYEVMDVMPSANGGRVVALSDRVLVYGATGQLQFSLREVTVPGDRTTSLWLMWACVLAGVLLLLYAFRMVFVHLMKRRFSLFLKQVIVTVPVIVVCMFLLSNFIYDSFSARMEVEMERELALLARNGQHLIDGSALERLTSPEDYRSADYNAIKKNMNFLFEGGDAADRKGLYSTLYKYDNGQLYIMMDDDDGVNMFKPFESSEANETVRREGAVVTGKWEDANGKWVYAIGPVYNQAGEVIGIYETGRDLNVLYQANRKIYTSILENIYIFTAVLLVIILLTTFVTLSKVRKLRRSVIEMADGNWGVEANVRSRDEVGDLAEQFNRMAEYIRKYIADITAFSEASHRFVPQQFFQSLGKKGILDIRLGDQVQKNMPVMVANLREFHKLSQQLTPKEVFNFMNSFLRRFGPLVRREDGLISKYLGAGFMALYPGTAEQSLRTAVAIRRELIEYNAGRRRAGYVPVEIGIAIHSGPLMMGIIGEERRWEGNVISDGVHLTETLEKLSDSLGASILVTRDLFETLREPERFRHRSLGRITPEGQDEAIELIDVYEGDPETMMQAKDRTRKLFERGLELCQEGRFYDARETFVEVLKLNRMDKAAKLYFFLCDEYFQKGTSSGWNGTLAV